MKYPQLKEKSKSVNSEIEHDINFPMQTAEVLGNIIEEHVYPAIWDSRTRNSMLSANEKQTFLKF